MALPCLYALLTMFGLAQYESADGVKGDCLPYLDQGIREPLDSLWWYLLVLGAQLDLGQGNKSQCHQCFSHPGTATYSGST